MIRNYSLRVRLSFGFLLILLVTLGIGGVGIYRVISISGINQTVYDHPYTVRNTLLEMRGDIQRMRSSLLLALYDESYSAERLGDRIGALDRETQKRFRLISERYLGSKTDFEELRNAYDDWSREVGRTVALLNGGDLEGARQLRHEEVFPRIEKLLAMTDVMNEVTARRVDLFIGEAHRERDQAVLTMAALLLIAAFGSSVVALLIIRSVSTPVEKLVTLSRELALGKDLEVKPVMYSDEIGQLENSFNAIIAANSQIVRQARTIAAGDYAQEVELRSEEDTLGLALRRMTLSLAERERESRTENWLKTGESQLGERMRGNYALDFLATAVVGFLAERLHAQIASLYLYDEKTGRLQLQGSYAGGELPEVFALGEGLVGQAANGHKPLLIDDLPADYLRIRSSTGEALPRHLFIIPFFFEERLIGVAELASLEPFADMEQEFVTRACAILGQGFNLALARREMESLLRTTLRQSDELQTQQEELAAINEELEEQAQNLRASEQRLREQQEELRATNEELEQKTCDLELQREKMLENARELEEAHQELETRAHEVEAASRYKSDFLANMSHELRTPLNSVLILARDLMENHSGNLLPPQVESAEVIHRSGIDLLNLINDVLDLSKIEAGKMDLFEETFALADVAGELKARFLPQARKKGIELDVRLEDAPETVHTDRQRLDQILNNLVSNAVKFTERGGVTIDFAAASCSMEPGILISVRDTGIGIAADQQKGIFESFRQADSSTSRTYGGTGLGLAIARDLAQLLGGSLEVQSAAGIGSTFTLRLPQSGLRSAAASGARGSESMRSPAQMVKPPSIEDDRALLAGSDRTILIIEDDPTFAATLRDVCRSLGFKAICALNGEAGLALARGYLPTAIILDLRLPGISGWQVLENLKADSVMRQIPVHITSCEQPSREAFDLGVVGFLTKPATREEMEGSLQNLEKTIEKSIKELLLVEDDDLLRGSIERLIANDDIAVTSVASGAAAFSALEERPFDCMVLDLGLPDISGFDLLKKLRSDPQWSLLPVIVYTGRELSREEERELRQISEAIIVKGGRSEERLVDETTIFLHRLVRNLNKTEQQYIINLHDRDFYLQGKVVMLVDDDMRNLFALAKVLEQRGLKVLKAEAGEKALTILREGPAVDLILMDIMMPGLDGYETTRAIRQLGMKTPVIALTAKAMMEDRDKCLAAGADDYLTKPVDMDRLMSMMRVWLYA
jgi:signal transduction histidine kinase/CheY-like chemotaxis protein/HAMP domain-containing protein